MSKHEQFEAQKSVESQEKVANLSSYGMERQDNAQTARDNQQKTGDLVSKGMLPELSFAVHSGHEMTAKEVKDAGIKCTKETQDDGTKVTKADYPTGVHVVSSDSPPIHKDGRTITTSNVETTFDPPNHANKKGEVLDEKGRVIAKSNKDGSVTVDTGDGGFVKQYPDGTISKISAIRSRDGKTFEELDTDSPLGGMRPGDVVKPEKH